MSLKNDYLGHPQGVDITLHDGTHVGSFGAQDFVLHPLNIKSAVTTLESTMLFIIYFLNFKINILYQKIVISE